jgi:hypothetical protein
MFSLAYEWKKGLSQNKVPGTYPAIYSIKMTIIISINSKFGECQALMGQSLLLTKKATSTKSVVMAIYRSNYYSLTFA